MGYIPYLSNLEMGRKVRLHYFANHGIVTEELKQIVSSIPVTKYVDKADMVEAAEKYQIKGLIHEEDNDLIQLTKKLSKTKEYKEMTKLVDELDVKIDTYLDITDSRIMPEGTTKNKFGFDMKKKDRINLDSVIEKVVIFKEKQYGKLLEQEIQELVSSETTFGRKKMDNRLVDINLLKLSPEYIPHKGESKNKQTRVVRESNKTQNTVLSQNQQSEPQNIQYTQNIQNIEEIDNEDIDVVIPDDSFYDDLSEPKYL